MAKSLTLVSDTEKFSTDLKKKKRWYTKILDSLGRIGKALLFPIATLPIAAILLRIGSQLPGGDPFSDFVQSLIYNGGNVMFANLHIVFAVGIAFGLTKDNRGEAALAGFIGIALTTLLMSSNGADLSNAIYKDINLPTDAYAITNAEGFHRIFSTVKNDSYDAILSNNVLNGIIVGSIVAYIYNKFNGVELPSVLGFFSGRRLIPVLTVLSIMIFGVLWSVIFPWIGYGLYLFSESLSHATGNRYSNAAIMGVYGFINRMLIPFGLHHIPNTLFWYTLPVFDTSSNPGIIKDALGNPVSGDIFAFLNGVPENNPAGTFQSGFFPIMMFGLPALVAVFYTCADNKEQKRRILSVFGSAALVSFLTGITEPLEFAFMFVSPALFLMHAVLTGFFGFITGLFGIQLGFGFSAGFIDYILSIPKSMDIIHANKTGLDAIMANPAWIFYIGGVAATTYYFLGKFMVNKFNLSVPGRGNNHISFGMESTTPSTSGQLSDKAKTIVKGLGGWGNITNYQNCATRLRYDVIDADKVDESTLKKAGALGLIKVSKTHVQVIIGPTVEILNNEISTHIGTSIDSTTPIKIVEQKVTSVKTKVMAVADGKVQKLDFAKDGVFSKGIVGEGAIIEIPSTQEKFKIYSPVDGKIEVTFPTNHAFGIKTNDGLEVLVHVGIDTIKLNGKPFKSNVKKGQVVKAGDLLAEVNAYEIRKNKLFPHPIIVLTSGEKIDLTKSSEIKKGDCLFTSK